MELYWIPLLMALDLFAAMVLPYLLSVYVGHVQPFLPYVSDCGVLIPERTVFSQLINIAVFFQFLFSYFRFEQVASIKNYQTNRSLVRLNKYCVCLGFCISFGLSLIGNAQLEHSGVTPKTKDSSGTESSSAILSQSSPSNSAVPIKNPDSASTYLGPYSEYAGMMQNIHWIGAFFAFVIGIVWMFAQACLTLKMGVKEFFWSRMSIAIMAAVFLVVGIILALLAAVKTERGKLAWDDSSHSLETRNGRYSIAAACCEWLVCFLIVAFTATFVPEFKTFDLDRASVSSKRTMCSSGPPRSPPQMHIPNPCDPTHVGYNPAEEQSLVLSRDPS